MSGDLDLLRAGEHLERDPSTLHTVENIPAQPHDAIEFEQAIAIGGIGGVPGGDEEQELG